MPVVSVTPRHLVLLELTASDCPTCQEIHQIIQDLKPDYRDQLEFITLDLSDATNRSHAQETARQFNSQVFVKKYQGDPGTVAVLNALNGEPVAMLQRNVDRARYQKMLKEALSGHRGPAG